MNGCESRTNVNRALNDTPLTFGRMDFVRRYGDFRLDVEVQ